MYICLVRSKQQRGLSTTFGWRLASLKMTDMWVARAFRACEGPLISAGGSHGNSRLGGPWWKCISVSRESQAAAGSFDYVRLAPRSAQDDRHVGCQHAQGVRRPLISAGGSHGNSRLGGPWWKCISVSREIRSEER